MEPLLLAVIIAYFTEGLLVALLCLRAEPDLQEEGDEMISAIFFTIMYMACIIGWPYIMYRVIRLYMAGEKEGDLF